MRILSFIFLLITCAATGFAQSPSWHQPPNAGLEVRTGYNRFEDVYFTSPSTGFAVSLSHRLFKTTDGGMTWQTKIDSPSARLRAVEFLQDGVTGLATGFNSPGKIFRTTDAGETWTDISAAITDTNYYTQIPNNTLDESKQICGLAHLGDNFYGVGWWGSPQCRFYKSTDRGLTWTTHFIDSSLATCLVDVHFLTPNKGFAVGGKRYKGHYPIRENVVLMTTDGGNTWSKVFSDTTLGGMIWKIQFLDNNRGVASVQPLYSTEVAMIRTVDGGASWQIVHTGHQRYNNGFTSMGNTQGVGFRTPMHGWIGGYYPGLFETKDGGQTWDSVAFGNNFNRFFVMDSNLVWASGKTIYRFADSTRFALNAPGGIENAPPHLLHPVAPNPAHGKVNIRFDLLSTTNVVLEVVSIDTRRVTSIVTGVLKPGHYEYTWDAKDAPTGQYLLWLGTDEIPITQRFELR